MGNVICSHCLVRNKCKESEDSCANCENLQYHVKEVLSELSSAKYIIKLLQKYLWDTAGLWNDSRSKTHMRLFIFVCRTVIECSLVMRCSSNCVWVCCRSAPEEFELECGVRLRV